MVSIPLAQARHSPMPELLRYSAIQQTLPLNRKLVANKHNRVWRPQHRQHCFKIYWSVGRKEMPTLTPISNLETCQACSLVCPTSPTRCEIWGPLKALQGPVAVQTAKRKSYFIRTGIPRLMNLNLGTIYLPPPGSLEPRHYGTSTTSPRILRHLWMRHLLLHSTQI